MYVVKQIQTFMKVSRSLLVVLKRNLAVYGQMCIGFRTTERIDACGIHLHISSNMHLLMIYKTTKQFLILRPIQSDTWKPFDADKKLNSPCSNVLL